MKKITLFFVGLFSFVAPAAAQQRQSEPAQLGTVAGVAMACGAYRQLYLYEEITSRLLSNTAANERVEKEMYKEYAIAKTNSFREQADRRKVPCSEAVDAFSKMPIFRFELYADGSLKTPEGRYLLPRRQKKFNPSAERLYPAPVPAAPRPTPPASPVPAAAPAQSGGFTRSAF